MILLMKYDKKERNTNMKTISLGIITFIAGIYLIGGILHDIAYYLSFNGLKLFRKRYATPVR